MSESRVDVVRARKAAECRSRLAEAERAALPEDPAGLTGRTDADPTVEQR